jgi:hypothetical protein
MSSIILLGFNLTGYSLHFKILQSKILHTRKHIFMPITVTLDPTLPGILRWDYPSRWTWDEYAAAEAAEHQLVAQTDLERYDGISVFVSTHVPSGNAIGQVHRTLKWRAAHKWGLTLVVTDSLFIKTMMNGLTRVAPNFTDDFIAVSSEAEAYAAIRAARGVPES